MRQAVRKLAAATRGLSAEHVALILAVGLVLGTFPVFGLPTVLCLGAALCLKVSVPALQLVNQISSPLQWLLLFPLERAGACIFGSGRQWGSVVLHAIAGWFCICVPLGFVLYLTLMYVLRRRREI